MLFHLYFLIINMFPFHRQFELVSRADRLSRERTAVAISGKKANDDVDKYTVRDCLVDISLFQ